MLPVRAGGVLMPVSKRLRYEILRRDNYTCRYCGRSAPEVKLTVDHVQPVALGGSDAPNNLAAACVDCNNGKTSTSPDDAVVADVSEDAIRWAKAMREAASVQDDDRYLIKCYRDAFLAEWSIWHYGEAHKPLPLPDDWPDSIERFYRLGLDEEIVLEMVAVAGRSRATVDKTFRYFCGCCYRVLEERQAIALALIAREEADGEA
jgi:hypothetical protein